MPEQTCVLIASMAGDEEVSPKLYDLLHQLVSANRKLREDPSDVETRNRREQLLAEVEALGFYAQLERVDPPGT